MDLREPPAQVFRTKLYWIDMNPDQALINAAYQEAIKSLYTTLYTSYAEAGGVAAQEQQAEQNFMAGITLARRSRDRAIALLA